MHFDSVGQEQFFLSIPQKAPNKLSQCLLLQCYTCVASQALVILDYYYCLCPPLTQDNVFSYSEKVLPIEQAFNDKYDYSSKIRQRTRSAQQ